MPNLPTGKTIRIFLALLLLPSLALAGEEAEENGGEEKRVLTAADIPTRIAEAEVGEWALYSLGDGGRLRLTVIEKWRQGGDTHLVIANEVTKGKDKSKGKRPTITEERITVKEAVKTLRDLRSEDTITESEILVHGRTIKTVVIHYMENGEVIRQSYLSDKIPVYGLVRGTTPKEKVKTPLSLIDYGFAEEEAE